MEEKGKFLSLILAGLGLAAVVSGFAAEATRTKGGEVGIIDSTVCVYPSSPAHGFGLLALGILCVIQLLATVTTRCACCRGKSPNEEISNSNTNLQRIFAIVSWITFVIAFILFLLATLVNSMTGVYYVCYVAKPGVFAGASILTLVCVGCGIGYVNLVFKATPMGNMYGTEGQFQPGLIPVGQPQNQYGLQLGRK